MLGRRHGAAVHAYVLMNNQVHLLMTPGSQTAVSRVLQAAYRGSFDEHLDVDTIDEMRLALAG